MVAPIGAERKSFYVPAGSSSLSNVYVTSATASGGSERVSLSGRAASRYESLNKALTALNQTKDALLKLSDLSGDILKVAEEAAGQNISTAARKRLENKFDTLVNEFNQVLDETERTAGVDLRNPAELVAMMQNAGLVPKVNGTLGKLIQALGGKDGLMGTEGVSIQNFVFTDQGSTRRFQENYTMELSGLDAKRVSNDAWKGGGAISGTTLTRKVGGEATVLFTTSADYELSNPLHYKGVASAATGTPVITVDYNAATPSADFSILDASSDGRYILVEKGGLGYPLQLYDRENGKTVATLLYNLSSSPYQGALSSDGTKAVFNINNSASGEIYFTPDQGANIYSEIVRGGTISGKVVASNDWAVYSSNATSLGGDGTNFDIFGRLGFSNLIMDSFHIDIDSADVGGAGAILNRESLSIAGNSTVLAFTVNGGSVEANGRLFLYDISSRTSFDTGLSGVTKTDLNADGSRLVVATTSGEVRVYDLTGGSPDLQGRIAFSGSSRRTASEVSINSSGDTIAFTAGFDGSTNEVFIATLDTGASGTYTFKAGAVKRVYTPGESAAGVPRSETDKPLDLSLATRGGASYASQAVKKLKEEIDKDIRRIEAIFESLGGKNVKHIKDPQKLVAAVLKNISQLGLAHDLDPRRVRDLLLE